MLTLIALVNRLELGALLRRGINKKVENRMFSRIAVCGSLVAAAFISACGGGSNDSTTTAPLPAPAPSPGSSPSSTAVGPCVSFKEVNGTVTTRVDNTLTMSVANSTNAIDGALNTPATLVVNGSTGPTQGVAIRATTQNGIAFPAGKTAGAFYSSLLLLPRPTPSRFALCCGAPPSRNPMPVITRVAGVVFLAATQVASQAS